jgi:hypothetical protein
MAAPKPDGCGAMPWTIGHGRDPVTRLPRTPIARTARRPASHLKGFRGLLQVDGYAGFGSLVKAATDGGLQLAFCWAHTRRKFYDIHVATKSPLAEQALRRIADLYAIEADIRGQTADERRTVRQERSRPLVEAMKAWLTETLDRISGRSALAQTIRYALNHWSGLVLFLDDGRLELNTNTVERAMRPVALGRKNALFLAHGLDGPLTEDRQLHLAHCSLHAQQQPVVGRTRIVDSFFVHNQCTDQTAELQQCMPITTVPSQAGSFQ